MTSTSFVVHIHPSPDRRRYPSTGFTGSSLYPQWPQQLSEAQRTSAIPIKWEPFLYHPTFCGKSQLRWLEPYPGVLGEPVFMRMIASNRDIFPINDYRCLSYMWGESAAEYEVILNGRSFHVKKNLYHFLRMASRHPKLMRHSDLWIDAMCIDQKNDVEKGHQVKKMGEIYRDAKETIIWLGDDPKIDVAVRRVGVCNWKRAEASDLESLKLLCNHEYWDRTWVTQEVLMSRTLKIMSAKHEVSWERCGVAIEICLRRGLMEGCIATAFWYMWKDTHQTRREKPPNQFDPCHDHSLWDLLLWRMSSSCMDARDRIYAMVDLTGDRHGRFPVDYTESIVNLFWRAGDHYGAWIRKDLTELLMQTLNLTVSDLALNIETTQEREITVSIKRIRRAHRWVQFGSRKIVCSHKSCHGHSLNAPSSFKPRWEYILCTQLDLPKFVNKQCVHLLVRQFLSQGRPDRELETALITPHGLDEASPVLYYTPPLKARTYYHGGEDGWFQLTSWSEAEKLFNGITPFERSLLKVKLQASFVVETLQNRQETSLEQPVSI